MCVTSKKLGMATTVDPDEDRLILRAELAKPPRRDDEKAMSPPQTPRYSP